MPRAAHAAAPDADDAAPIWQANPGPQTEFLASSAYECLYGGAAGGGKSESLLVAPLRWVGHRAFSALLLRRTFPELEKTLIARSRQIYPLVDPGATYNKIERRWTFSSGATIYFGYCERDSDVEQYQGAEFCFLGFDEGTHFSLYIYTYLLSRLRSPAGLPIRVRMGTNPGGPGHEWVMRRWAPWLDRSAEYKGPRAAPGETVWYVDDPDGGGERWITDRDELDGMLAAWAAATPEERLRLPLPLSRQFIPAKVADNPHLVENDPSYIVRLRGLDPVSRRRLLEGDWLVQPAAGLYYQRAWFKWLDEAPTDYVARIRRWDLASTENGGDWTVGVRMVRPRGSALWVIDDVVRVRMRPAGVKATVKATAELDGKRTRILLPKDPGQAGVGQADDYALELAGYDVRFERETGDKVTRQQPLSAQVEARNVALVRAPWNEAFLQVLEAFPEGDHDDDVDAAAGAFNAMADVSAAGNYIAAVKAAAARHTR